MTDPVRTFSDLVRVETLLWNAADAALRDECALSLARFETMQVLGRSGPCRVQDIADELAIGWSGASKIVDRVEAAGHCRRRPHPGDARSTLVSLTPRGRALLRKASVCVTRTLQRHLADAMPPGELDRFSRSLARLRSTVATSLLP